MAPLRGVAETLSCTLFSKAEKRFDGCVTSAQLTLRPKPPFSFKHTLSFLEGFKADGVYKRIENGVLKQALLIDNCPVLMRLESSGTLENPRLKCELTSKTELSEELLALAESELRFYLGLDDDLLPFYALAEKDDAFKPVLESLYGYHLVKFPTVFSSVCWALVTQRTPNSFAFKSVEALTHLLGKPFKDEKDYTTFPTPESFLTKGAAEKILKATNNTRKTERLIPLARQFLESDKQFLRTAPYEKVYRWLKKLPGLGEWSVDYIMLRGLGRAERTPWTDTWLLEAISRVYTGGLRISKGDARKLAEGYGWYQGWWVHYMKTALW